MWADVKKNPKLVLPQVAFVKPMLTQLHEEGLCPVLQLSQTSHLEDKPVSSGALPGRALQYQVPRVCPLSFLPLVASDFSFKTNFLQLWTLKITYRSCGLSPLGSINDKGYK